MVCRWEQELLGYHFTIVHISNNMMVDVDALTWRFGHLISHNIAIADLLSSRERAKRPHVYATTKFINLGNVKITETDNHSIDPPPLLTSYILHRFYRDITNHLATASSLDPSSYPYITTLPINMCPSPNLCSISPLHDFITPDTAMSALQTPQFLEI